MYVGWRVHVGYTPGHASPPSRGHDETVAIMKVAVNDVVTWMRGQQGFEISCVRPVVAAARTGNHPTTKTLNLRPVGVLAVLVDEKVKLNPRPWYQPDNIQKPRFDAATVQITCDLQNTNWPIRTWNFGGVTYHTET